MKLRLRAKNGKTKMKNLISNYCFQAINILSIIKNRQPGMLQYLFWPDPLDFPKIGDLYINLCCNHFVIYIASYTLQSLRKNKRIIRSCSRVSIYIWLTNITPPKKHLEIKSKAGDT